MKLANNMTIEQMLEEARKFDLRDTEDCTENGECSSCGNCCSMILPVTEEELQAIKKYIDENDVREQRGLRVTVNPVGSCPFRDEMNRKCTIYPVRPSICRLYRCDKAKDGSMFRELDRKEIFKKREEVCMRYVFFGRWI